MIYNILLIILGSSVSIIVLYYYSKWQWWYIKLLVKMVRTQLCFNAIKRIIREMKEKPRTEANLRRIIELGEAMEKVDVLLEPITGDVPSGMSGIKRFIFICRRSILLASRDIVSSKRRENGISALDEVYSILKAEIDKETNPNEEGNILLETLFFAVPALISLTLTGTLAYLVISNKGVSDYKAPEAVTKPLGIIIGYFCGMGASKVSGNKKTATE
ncbi:hypothetical protein ACFL6S_14280 [Candidatus Poribacteria bacterium]